jgi:hypothetical protein
VVLMTDRELLELAAKAAGIELAWSPVDGISPRNKAGWHTWNPLADDGDALRLAVMLRMDIAHFEQPVRVNVNGYDDCCEPIGTNTYAATRRAIVRAAAEVGKGM